MVDQSLRDFSISRVLSRAFAALGANIAVFLILGLGLDFLPDLAGAWLTLNMEEGMASFQISNLIGATFGLLGTMSMLSAALRAMSGRSVHAGEAFADGMRLFFPGFGISWLTNMGVILGLILLVVPGLMLMTWWCVALPARVAGGEGVTAAIRRSRELTKGHRWPIFGILVVGVIAYFVPLMLVSVMIALAFGGDMPTFIDLAIVPLGTMIFSIISAAVIASIYHELVDIKGGSTASTADVFA